MKKLKFEFELTLAEYDLLHHIAEKRCVEYQDTEFETVEEFRKKVKPAHAMTEEQFLERNNDGSYHLTKRLYEFNLIQRVDLAWHTTFKLSEFGKSVLIFNEIDYETQS